MCSECIFTCSCIGMTQISPDGLKRAEIQLQLIAKRDHACKSCRLEVGNVLPVMGNVVKGTGRNSRHTLLYLCSSALQCCFFSDPLKFLQAQHVWFAPRKARPGQEESWRAAGFHCGFSCRICYSFWREQSYWKGKLLAFRALAYCILVPFSRAMTSLYSVLHIENSEIPELTTCTSACSHSVLTLNVINCFSLMWQKKIWMSLCW